MADRRVNWLLVAKCGWLSANVTILLMGLGSCLNDPYCVPGYALLTFVYLLSFPASTLFLVFNSLMLSLGLFFDGPPISHYVFLGLGSLVVGYVQWFRVVPALLGKPRITVLSLNQMSSDKKGCTEPTGQAGLIESQIQPFDETGCTPLERVINQK